MNETLSHKQTRFGEIVSPVTVESEGLSENFLHGIRVRTNNSSLTSQLSLMATEKPEDLRVEFLYLTGQAANIGDMYTLQSMDQSHAGGNRH